MIGFIRSDQRTTANLFSPLSEAGGSGIKFPDPVQEVMRSNLSWGDIRFSDWAVSCQISYNTQDIAMKLNVKFIYLCLSLYLFFILCFSFSLFSFFPSSLSFSYIKRAMYLTEQGFPFIHLPFEND